MSCSRDDSRKVKLLVPRKDGIYAIAAEQFVSYWQKITSEILPVITEDDGRSDLIVLGSDAVNVFTHRQIIEKVIPSLKLITGTDGYQLLSARKGSRNLLFIAGARPRALLYAVYRFFEIQAGCRYFWDGDIVPRQQCIDIMGLDLYEKPRFQYRGLRYFAHRGLNRFQAEHWDFEEWKKEIDWILKKRLNLFMLRIGIDDLFQLAFPEIVHYPAGYEIPESIKNSSRGFNNRDLFWDLEFRGWLRKKILAYAAERDLMHPVDMGTMTHWYSRTPFEYLDRVKPDFLPQAVSSRYGEKTGLVWDIRQDRFLDDYWKLTETMIEHYDRPEIFHTIGLAERQCYEDRDQNQQMKLYAYRRLQGKLREKYPSAPLLIGTWDFSMHWKEKEVRSLIKELNAENTLIFDYTSDTSDQKNNFVHWGINGRFPWIFGIFHAYAPATEIRGNYHELEERMALAADDPMCRGLVYWPECSHSDTVMLDFMPAIAWNPENCDIDGFLPRFCRARYPDHAEQMLALWKIFMPLAKKIGWCGPQDLEAFWVSFSDLIFKPLEKCWSELNPGNLARHLRQKEHLKDVIDDTPEMFRLLAGRSRDIRSEFMRRDLTDMGRTVISRLQTYAISGLILMLEAWRTGRTASETVLNLLDEVIRSAELEEELLAAHADFSMYESLLLLQKKHQTNPDFEDVLKENSENGYCRSYVCELFRGVYLPELRVYSAWVRSKIQAGDVSPWTRPAQFDDERQKILAQFHATPLKQLAPDRTAAAEMLPETLEKLSETAEKMLALLQQNHS